MLGKTNIIYVTKDQSSEMQFVTETIITRSSSDIVKMKYLNGVFFAFTDANRVLYGSNLLELAFLQREGQPLSASDIEYFDGKYVFINADECFEGKVPIFASEDLSTFEEFDIKAIRQTNKVVGIAINSYDQLVFLVLACQNFSKMKDGECAYNSDFNVLTCGSLTGEINFEIQSSSRMDYAAGKYCNKCVFMRDRFFFYSNGGAAGDEKSFFNCVTLDAVVKTASEGTFPVGVIDNMAYTCIGGNTYYTLNFENYVKVRSIPTKCCIPVKGRIGLYNDGILEIGSKVNDFVSGITKSLEITGIDYEVLCFVEAEEYTYLGCQGGVIIQCFMDIDGTYQTPEIALVKTLAAKEALEKAKEYTDVQLADLRNYIDSRLA